MKTCSSKHTDRIFLLAALLSAPALFAAQPPLFDLLDLGTVNEGLPTSGNAINNRGDIAGDYEDTNNINSPFLYRKGEFILPSVPPGPYNEVYFTDINERGTAVGIANGDTDFTAAFIFDRGSLRSLSNVLRYPIVFKIAINNSGALAGTALLEDHGKEFGFVHRHGVRTVVPSLIPGGQTAVHDLNNAGVAVGVAEYALSDDPSSPSWHAVIFAKHRVKDLGALPGGAMSFGTAINDRGHAVGWSWTATPSATHAFVYRDGAMHDLGTLPDDEVSMATAINNRGEIVGHSVTHVGRFRAVWFGDRTVYDLNTLLAEPTDLVLEQAAGINERGQIIARGWTGNYPRAVLLTPRSGKK